VGLRALLDVAGLTGKTIDSYHIAFMVAPRVNAAGRMSTADIATRLLLASDEAMAGEAQGLALQLDAENTRRRDEEQDIVAAARKAVETDPEVGAHPVLVAAGEGWHRGVIGIVASKLVDAFYRPAIVLSVDGDHAHGSCRSIPGFDVLAALESAGHLLERFGGHKQAAGLQLATRDIPAFRQAVNAHAHEHLGPDDLRPNLHLDGELGFDAITPAVVDDLVAMAPFGLGNPKPLFTAGPIDVVDGPRRLKERHLKMSLRQHGRTFRAIAWNGVAKEPVLSAGAGALEVAYSLERNEFNGNVYTELRLSDARRSD
jgi:single-stranded-DNA-specific exonuclease